MLRVIRTIAALAVAVPGLPLAAAESITVATWGGIYSYASQKAYHEAFTAETGIEVRLDDYGGGLSEIRAQVDSGRVFWDVVDFELADLVRACEEGLVEMVDIDSLPPAPDGARAREDYYEGTASECGGGGLYWSIYYAYNSKTFPGAKPTTLEDFFDLAKFPGKRGLRRTPYTNLELALMADGVAPEDVYAVLDKPEGVERAFRKLETIKDSVIWWELSSQPPQMLVARDVAMTTSWNGRIFEGHMVHKEPFVPVWDGQVLESGQLGIISGTPRLEAAKKFLMFASRPEYMAAVSRYIPYSPVRKSATSLISTHFLTGVDMWSHMPNNPQNRRRSLHSSWEWWADNLDEMAGRFNAWLLR